MLTRVSDMHPMHHDGNVLADPLLGVLNLANNWIKWRGLFSAAVKMLQACVEVENRTQEDDVCHQCL